jgi:ribosome-binding ATPase
MLADLFVGLFVCTDLFLLQSTFFNAATRAVLDSRGGRKVAEVAAHPFTTIEPNIGPGWYLSGQDDCCSEEEEGGGEGAALSGGSRRSSAFGRGSARQQHRRLLPVVVKDVAGLVPGAYQGRGKGNKFLGDLCEADVLVHVVSDRRGQERRGEEREELISAHLPASLTLSAALNSKILCISSLSDSV